MVALFRIEDQDGALLARGSRAMDSLIGMVEMIVTDALDQFLLAFRLKSPPGRPIVQVNIPFLVVDDEGRTIGELRGRFQGLRGRSYVLMSQGAEYLSIPEAYRSKPYPILQRGTPVGEITEQRPLLGEPWKTTWSLQFTAPCQHLHAMALLIHVAAHRGGPGIPAG
ncbi:MAG TPA: hypothetical protein VEH57_04045 [Thermoplasmata archaeon]|nr:hypothetical protein [Thermoplasmata archaeon]